ncbi:MAG: OmcA/MtrC family decaheme c-type cytochrome, partial [Bryobacteraceae bacterium]
TDAGGRFERVADGEYVYTFGVKAPASIDRKATHSIGLYSSRVLTEFDLGTQFSDHVFHFVPDGTAVATVRNVVNTSSCNKCHDPLSAHGGARQSVELCVMCHTPQTTDPDTGNTVDFPVMVHKIHQGAGLPSVVAGGKYQIIGFGQSVNDYSTVRFPADARNCTFCHEQGTGNNAAKQQTAFLKPSRAACGSCHDNVNFATGANHADLPQVSDNQCATCHVPQGELEFDVSIFGAHTIPTKSQSLPGTVFEMVRVDDGAAGKRPTVTFRVKDKAGKPILPSEMTRLALILAGPTSDYASYVSENALTATGDAASGTFFWTFANAIPADAKGTFSVGIEGYRNIRLLEGTRKEQTVRDTGANRVIHFAVDGGRVQPRRAVVSIAKCNSCHSALSLHGGNRNQIEQCVLCHNPGQTDTGNRPAALRPAESVDFRSMIHKIHTGEELGIEFTIYGNGASKNDFTEVRFPGDRRNCDTCHINGSEQLPLSPDLLDVAQPRGFGKSTGPTSIGPVTAACTGCHTSLDAAAHALVNTSPLLGESCRTCHGPAAEFSVDRVHAR